MKIYNEEKTQILNNPDLEKGYLRQDKIVSKIVPAQEEVKEQYHYETIREYENGGKDVKKVVDVPYQPSKPETYEYEDIQIYIPYTQKELNEQRKVKISFRLNQLSQDFIQSLAGAEIENLEERRLEFQKLHNELRVLEGKEPRKYS